MQRQGTDVSQHMRANWNEQQTNVVPNWRLSAPWYAHSKVQHLPHCKTLSPGTARRASHPGVHGVFWRKPCLAGQPIRLSTATKPA